MTAGFLRRAAAAVALCAPFAVPAPAAYALPTDVVALAGSGSISPGLPSAPSWINFEFNAVAVGTHAGAYLGCTYQAYAPIATQLDDSGVGTIAGCGVGGVVGYHRLGAIVTVEGEVTLGSEAVCILQSALVFVQTSVLPTTSFIASGTVVLGDC
jgi:hypothetical protein